MRVALIGHGHMGRHHARHLASRAELTVIDPAQGLAGALEGVDAAVIATPTLTHLSVAEPLLRRGVPCLVEKPLAHTLDAARALASYEGTFVGHIERFNPALRPMLARADGSQADASFVQAERVSRPHARGRDVDVVLDLMIHDLDLFLALVREPVAEVRANGVAVTGGGLDVAHARVETASGRVGVFTASRLARADVRRLRVFADGAYWSADLRERTCARVAWDGSALEERLVDVPAYDALGAQLDAFLDAVRAHGTRGAASAADGPSTASSGVLPLAGGADGLAALELALRVRDAAARAPGGVSSPAHGSHGA